MPDHPAPPSPEGRGASPGPRVARVLAGYACFGVAWILLSDRVLFAVAPDMASLSMLGLWKGLSFIVLSTLLLYLLMRRPSRAAPAGADPDDALDRPALAAPSGWFWGAFAALAAVIVAAGLVGVAASASDLRANELEDLHVFARGRVSLIAAWRAARLDDAQVIGNDQIFGAAVRDWRRDASPASRVLVMSQLRRLALTADYEEAALVDGTGRVLLTGSGADLVPPSPEVVRRALVTGRLAESGMQPLGRDGGLRLDIVAPARGDGADHSFAVVLRADPTRRLLPQIGLYEDVGGRQLVLLVRGSDGRLHDANALSARADTVPETVMQWVEGLGRDFGRHGGPVPGAEVLESNGLSLAMAVADTPWIVLVHSPGEPIQSGIMKRAAWVALTDVVVLVMAAAMLLFAWERRELRAARRQGEEQAERLRALGLLDAIANGSTDAIFAKDLEGRYLLVNDPMCRILGKSRDEILGRTAWEVGDPVQARRRWQLQLDIARGGVARTTEGWSETPTGRRYFVEITGPLRNAAGELAGLFCTARDVTARHHEEERMRQWAAAMAATREGVVITDRESRIVAVNRAFTTITGWPEADVLGRTPAMLRSGRHDADFYRAMWQALREHGHWQGEIWNRRRGGEQYPQWLTVSAVRDAAGEVTHYVGVFSDISRLKQNEAQVERLVHYDALTELPNRRLMQQRITQALAHVDRHRSLDEGQRLRAAVLTLDLDNLKSINDSLDHAAGDEVLVTVANRLRERVRAEDTLGRLGGDEFVVLLEDVSQSGGVMKLADDLLNAVDQPIQLADGGEVRVTASLGIAMYPDDGAEDAAQMLRNADAALHRAKQSGPNHFSFFTSDLHAEASSRLDMATGLSHAIERGELTLHYQAQVEAGTARVVSAEALLRWVRPGGMVSPAQFIPVLEETSLILEVGEWVIRTACAQVRAWIDAGLPVVPISVNTSARQFLAGDLDLVVARALQDHAVPPELLVVELTESAFMAHGTESLLRLHRLKSLGVQLSVDDFGTGYSSLAYLHQLPIDELKIDRAFVNSIGRGEDGGAIADLVLALGERLGLRVVAEGVETEAQRDYLREHGCARLQGFLFARPVPAEALQARLAAQAAEPEPADAPVAATATASGAGSAKVVPLRAP